MTDKDASPLDTLEDRPPAPSPAATQLYSVLKTTMEAHAWHKPIPDETQKNILTKSRRRCCLCFWLEGRDEVQKGQIAHLDGDNENAAEDNLAFLCFDHHDEYDGTTRLAKGLREDEAKHWRDELYREMAYRFRVGTADRRLKDQLAAFLVEARGH